MIGAKASRLAVALGMSGAIAAKGVMAIAPPHAAVRAPLRSPLCRSQSDTKPPASIPPTPRIRTMMPIANPLSDLPTANVLSRNSAIHAR